MGIFDGGGKMGRNSTQTGAGGPSGTGGASKGKGTAGNAGAAGGNQYAGYRGPTGTRTPTSAAPGSYGLSGSETRLYNDAKTEYQNRSFGKRVFDFFSPIKSIDPQINQPASYAEGQYHHGINPASLAAGLVAPYGSGLIAGPVAGALYNDAGMHNIVTSGPGGGFSTSYPDGGPGYNSSTGYAGPKGPPSTPQGKSDQSGLMAGFQGPAAQAPGGAPFGAQPSTPQHPVQNPMAAFFKPQIPNHTVPQGFNSAFPNSLTEQDKALLYANALSGRTA